VIILQKQEANTVPWTMKQTILGMCCTLLPYLLYSWSSLLFNTKSTTSLRSVSPQLDLLNAILVILLSLIIYCLFFLSAPVYLAVKTSRLQSGQKWAMRDMLDALGFRKFSWRSSLLLIILLFLGIFLLNIAYSWLISYFHLPLQTNDQRVLEQGRTTPISLYATLLIAVVVAPVCEEIFFRSFLLMGFLRAMPLGLALVVNSLLFAFSHADIGSFAVLVFIGLALAFLRWYCKSIWPGIILHALNNAAGALTIILALHGVSL
jgi:membrane protease YdiL (CAAX protease family)